MKHIKKFEIMKIKVLLFGILAEDSGKQTLQVNDIDNTLALTEHLMTQYPSFAKYKFRISVNQNLIDGNKKLNDGDEVALLPPFAGG